jgi:16S rRNA (guanine966-N2)-methyltransferase
MWRGRKFRFPEVQGLRPTPDRVRETLFNWLAPRIVGARCLDLFAGSGALGLEALSRGAAAVRFIEREPGAAADLRAMLARFDARGAQVVEADAMRHLAGPASPFDIIFVDPPFDAGLLPETLARVLTGGWLAPGGVVYVEQSARSPLPPLPPGRAVAKSGRAGDVGYHLLA